MKILRLSPIDARQWRENRSLLVSAEGEKVRDLDVNESRVLSDLQRKVRQVRKPMTVETKGDDGKKITITVVPVITGNVMTLENRIDGLLVHDGREFFMAQVLKIHGECQLRDRTGRFLKSIRDVSFVRPNAKEAARLSPRPAFCECRGWGGPEAGTRHHQSCQWNSRSVDEERAIATVGNFLPSGPPAIPQKPSILDQKPRERGISPTAVFARTASVPSPLTCDQGCSEWAKTNGSEEGQHHPICKHFDAWKVLAGRTAEKRERMLLVSLSTGESSREATSEEAREAAGEKGFIVIGSEEFAVVPESEVKAVA